MAAVEIPKMKLIKTESEGNDVSSETAEEAAPAVNVNDSISCAVREELADAVRARSISCAVREELADAVRARSFII